MVQGSSRGSIPSTANTTERVLLNIVVSLHVQVIDQLRGAIDKFGALNDAGAQDFATEVLQQHEKMAWKLKSSRPQKG